MKIPRALPPRIRKVAWKAEVQGPAGRISLVTRWQHALARRATPRGRANADPSLERPRTGCSPDEARRLLGLPDVSSMQAAVLATFEKRMVDAADAFAPEAVLKLAIVVFHSPKRLRDMFANFFKPQT
ncbi:MAG: DUF6489 family protein [Pseudomonadota bacterium]|nr:DUF6489 family protein [Pseudomonadota bacterium]